MMKRAWSGAGGQAGGEAVYCDAPHASGDARHPARWWSLRAHHGGDGRGERWCSGGLGMSAASHRMSRVGEGLGLGCAGLTLDLRVLAAGVGQAVCVCVCVCGGGR